MTYLTYLLLLLQLRASSAFITPVSSSCFVRTQLAAEMNLREIYESLTKNEEIRQNLLSTFVDFSEQKSNFESEISKLEKQLSEEKQIQNDLIKRLELVEENIEKEKQLGKEQIEDLDKKFKLKNEPVLQEIYA